MNSFSIENILGLPTKSSPSRQNGVQVAPGVIGQSQAEYFSYRDQIHFTFLKQDQLSLGFPPLALQQALLLQSYKRPTALPSETILGAAGMARKVNRPASESERSYSTPEMDSEVNSPADRSPPALINIPNNASKEEERRSKKNRTSFSRYQSEELELKFNEIKYLTKTDRIALSKKLDITEQIVKTWFQNRRTRWKKEFSEETLRKHREVAAAKGYIQHLQEQI